MNGTSTEYLLILTAVTAGVTFLLRALPFLFFGTGKRPPALVLSIGNVLSPAAIAMLVVYCFACYVRDRAPAEHMFGLAEIAAAIVVVALQLWKRNPLVSILAGTAVYMTLVQTVIP
ncbi:MAG: AzlD domain-containing protein [Lentisphaeria bacterium]|nr:AzlD domain-containing protein [Lentisphaeria bacterium]